jgi:iron uptake system EfeUOB component EfeO/EfeM
MKKKGKLQMDSYLDKINEILKKNLSSKAFELWTKLNKKKLKSMLG